MSDPFLIEVLRGQHVESVHRGAIAICDDTGRILLEIGDVGRPVFPRSAIKSMQALPLVESGAADAYGFGNRELALACASHSGEPAHTQLAQSMLVRIGLDEGALECGSHWPSNHDATIALARTGGSPSALHNNCSGKHSGFLCACHHLRIRHIGYVGYDHPFQGMIRETMKDVTGVAHDASNVAVDGCSIPTYAIPLKDLARGFARMVTGKGLAAARAKAAQRLLGACMAEPFYTSGTDAADCAVMQTAPGRIFVKGGAEGVACAALTQLGIGIALKCDDGAARASEATIAAVLARIFARDEDVSSKLDGLARLPVKSRIGAPVGEVRPTQALDALRIEL